KSILDLPAHQGGGSARGYVRPRARLICRHLTRVAGGSIEAGRGGTAGDTGHAGPCRGRPRRHQPLEALHPGELPRVDRQVRVIGELRMCRTSSPTTDLSVTADPAHLDVRTVRQGAGRVPATRPAVLP